MGPDDDEYGLAAPNRIGTQIIQVVHKELREFLASAENIPWDDSKPQQGEGVKVLQVTVHPRGADSHLLVEVIIHAVEETNLADHIVVALFRDTEPDAIAASCAQVNGHFEQYNGLVSTIILRHVIHLEEKPTVKLIVRAGTDGGRININGGVGSRKLGGTLISSITVTEIAH